MSKTLEAMESEIMAHRYIYYVLNDNIIHDLVYDQLERVAIATLPETSPVHNVGSSLHTSYSPDVVQLALQMLEEAGH